jgi:hypothetical protein
MLASFLLATLPPVYGTDIPPHFRDASWSAYSRCLRAERNSANEPFRGPDPTATIAGASALIAYCGAERSRALVALRGHIQVRHPDWTAERIARSAEFVLTGFDLQRLIDARRPEGCGTHCTPDPEF